MQVGVISILLMSLLAGEGVELSAVREFRHQRLDQAALLLQLLQHRKRSRRERRSAWRAEQIRISYLGGRIAIQRRRYQEAIHWLAPIHRNYGKSSGIGDYVSYHLARAYLFHRQPKKAVKVLRWIMKNYNWRWRRKARRKLIVALRLARQWKDLTKLLKKIQRYPSAYGGRKWVWWKRLEAQARSGDVKGAARGMQRFLLYYPGGHLAYRARSKLKSWQQRKLCSVKRLRWSQRRFQLSRMARYHPKQTIKEAPLWWQDLSPSRRKSRYNRGAYRLMMSLAYIKAERLKDAIPILQVILKDKSSPGYAHRLAIRRLGKVYRDLGMYKEGEKALRRFAKRYSKYSRTASWAMYYAAWMAVYQEKYRRAYKLFGRYLQASRRISRKRRWRVQWFRAWCQFKLGRYRGAIHRFEQLGKRARYYTDRRRCAYWTARAYERQGKWRSARKHFAKLAKGSPLSYYGLLSQQRLYHLEVILPGQMKRASCVRGVAKRGKHHRWTPTIYMPSRVHRFKVGGRPWVEMVAHSFSTKKPAQHLTKEVRTHIQKAAKEAALPAIFPSIPKRCKRAQWYACKAWRRARLLSEIGLNRDAAYELFRGRRAIRRSLPKLLASIRWLRSVGAYHQAVRYSYMLSGPQPRRGLSQETWMKILYPPAFSKHLVSHARKNGISPAFAWAVMREESLYNPRATSGVGAKGLMQVINYTGRRIAKQLQVKRFRPRHLYRPAQSIRFGTWYLGQLTRKFGGHMLLAAAGYNAGPHRITVWLKNRKHLGFDEFVEELFFTETRVYVKRIFRTYAAYSFLYLRRLPSAPPTVAIQVGNNIDF